MGALPWQPEPLPPFLLLRAVPHTFIPHYSPPFGIFAPFFNLFPQRYHQTLWRGRREGSAGTFQSIPKLFPPFSHRAPGGGGRGKGGGAPHLLPKISQSLCSRSHHQLPHGVLLRLAVLHLHPGSVTGGILSSSSNPAQGWC